MHNTNLVGTLVGEVVAAHGNMIQIKGQPMANGTLVEIASAGESAAPSAATVTGQIVGFDADRYAVALFTNHQNVVCGAEVYQRKSHNSMFSANLLGTVIDPLAHVIRRYTPDSAFGDNNFSAASDFAQAPQIFERGIIKKQFVTGLRVLDGLLAVGYGQRLAVLAEPGVGKSTLITHIANASTADVNIIALIGERGREVVEMFEHGLNSATRRKTIGVVATSDQSALSRITAAQTATRLAQYFARRNKHVLLQVDSLTRLFRAYREIGIASGEMPVRRGYPPSVFADLPDLIERAGVMQSGSITAFYTVLLSSDLDEDPMVDEVKGLTDGHIVLRKDFAERGHFPAIDPLASLSRLMPQIIAREQLQAAQLFARHWQTLQNSNELIALGVTEDKELKSALKNREPMSNFLQQTAHEHAPLADTIAQLVKITEGFDQI